MSDNMIIITLRLQAWERAKGELRGILQTYWAPPVNEQTFGDVKRLVDKFIQEMQGEIG